MEEESTQPGMTRLQISSSSDLDTYHLHFIATQQLIDARRVGGHNTGFSDTDLADIFCVLHPASPPAYEATTAIAEENPDLTVSIDAADPALPADKAAAKAQLPSFELASQGLTDRKIALRLSGPVKDPILGYCFGRNPKRCDVVLGQNDSMKRISNIHFRIYINDHGIIMIEDQSTNGTGVDDRMLRVNKKEEGAQYRHTLHNGAMITLVNTRPHPDLKFIVRIPFRDGIHEDNYNDNVAKHIAARKHQIYLKENREAPEGGGPVSFAPQNLCPSC
jgi:hypothetical protein